GDALEDRIPHGHRAGSIRRYADHVIVVAVAELICDSSPHFVGNHDVALHVVKNTLRDHEALVLFDDTRASAAVAPRAGDNLREPSAWPHDLLAATGQHVGTLAGYLLGETDHLPRFIEKLLDAAGVGFCSRNLSINLALIERRQRRH